jgi:pteridine reductase
VRVCSIAPGTVAMPPDYDDDKQQRIINRIPLKRVGSPEDVASTVVFLTKAQYLSGLTIPVDGGRNVVL